MGILGLGPIIVCKDVAQRASHRCSNKGATLAGVPDQIVELYLISHQSSGQFFSVSLAALCEFADDATPLIAVLGGARPRSVSQTP